MTFNSVGFGVCKVYEPVIMRSGFLDLLALDRLAPLQCRDDIPADGPRELELSNLFVSYKLER